MWATILTSKWSAIGLVALAFGVMLFIIISQAKANERQDIALRTATATLKQATVWSQALGAQLDRETQINAKATQTRKTIQAAKKNDQTMPSPAFVATIDSLRR